MVRLTRDEILAADDLPFEDVPVQEWKKGGEVPLVRVRTLTAGERDRYEMLAYFDKGTTTEDVRAKLIALCVVDEAGERMFTELDIKALTKKSGIALNRLWEVAARLSGLTNADVKELAKN